MADNWGAVAVPTWRIAGTKAVGRVVSSVVGRPLRDVHSAVRWFAKTATRSIWKKGAVCQTSDFVRYAGSREVQALAIDVALRFVIGIPNMTVQPRYQVNEDSVARRVWALSARNWNIDLPDRGLWRGRNQR